MCELWLLWADTVARVPWDQCMAQHEILQTSVGFPTHESLDGFSCDVLEFADNLEGMREC